MYIQKHYHFNFPASTKIKAFANIRHFKHNQSNTKKCIKPNLCFNHRMDDRLWMNHNFNFIISSSIQVVGFNDFQTLSKKRGTYFLIPGTLYHSSTSVGWSTVFQSELQTKREQTLLKRVAESTVIFFPIFQLGCFKASATLTSFSLSTGQSLLVTK